MECDGWNTIQAREKLSNVHEVQCSDWTLDVVFMVRDVMEVVWWVNCE